MTSSPLDPTSLSPWQQLCRHYAMSDDTELPSPIKFMDEESVFFTAHHGPRSVEEVQRILDTPHLLELLKEQWQKEPPTQAVLARMNQTPEGRELKELAL